MDFLYFLLFSTLESLSLFAIMLSLFRFRITEYMGYYLLLSLLLSLFSYSMWRELDLSAYVAVVAVFLFSLAIFVRYSMSLAAAILISLLGYTVFGLVQSLVLSSLEALQWVALERVRGNTGDTYLMQTASSLVLFAISYFIYRRGYGFTFPLGLLEWRGENLFVGSLMLFILFLLACFSVFGDRVYLAAIAFFITMLLLLYVLVRKERHYVRQLLGTGRRQH